MIEQEDLNRTIALAGIFQAATLVDILSTQGRAPEESFLESINSIFQTSSESITDIYCSSQRTRLGLDALQQVLLYPKEHSAAQLLRYSKAMMRLERIIARQQKMHQLIKSRLDHYRRYLTLFDSVTSHSVISKLASLYIDTAGTSKYRVIVRGDPSLLTPLAQREKICATLLAGIRAAHLWRNLGGHEWELSFRKKYLLRHVTELSAASVFTAPYPVE
jgi:high frequency lysogenization protein